MAKAKAEENVSDDFQQKLLAFYRENLKDVDEKELQATLDSFKKDATKVSKIVKSSIVNTKYQEYVDNLKEIKSQLNKILKDSEPIVFLSGQNRVPITGKLVGYDSSTGDIVVEYMNDKKEVERKPIKFKSVIDDISKIPPPKIARAKKK